MLGGKWDDRRRAAKRRRNRGAVEVIGADDPGGRALLDVAVAVYTPRQDQPAARIDLARSRTEALAEGRHDPVLDADIADCRVCGGRNSAVADHQIVIAHPSPSTYWSYNASSNGGRSSATVAHRGTKQKGSP